jgi:hypothetical protein
VSLVAQLVGFGLRQVIGDFGGDIAQVVGVVEQRFRDHSGRLPEALDRAHQRAWQALGVALAGDGLLDRVKVFFASGDDKGVREQVQLFLGSSRFLVGNFRPGKPLKLCNSRSKSSFAPQENLSCFGDG